MIQRVENYLMDCVKSGSPLRRALALLALAVGGVLALAVGALVAITQIAALYMVAGWMGTESAALPALVLVVFMYPFWRWWRWRRRQGDAKVMAKVFADLDAGKFD